MGSGGNDGNSGLTWALRKLTLNGAEDVPVVAGDTVYVAPGVYREQLTVDVSGGAGSPIIYIGDVTGEHTDGVGGIVRITASDNDQTPARNYCIDDNAIQRNYRTFRGFTMDLADLSGIFSDGGNTNWIVEDCTFQGSDISQIHVAGATQALWTIRRCMFCLAANESGIRFTHTAEVDNSGHIVEDCVIYGGPNQGYGVRPDAVGGITIRGMTFFGNLYSVRTTIALTVGQSAS